MATMGEYIKQLIDESYVPTTLRAVVQKHPRWAHPTASTASKTNTTSAKAQRGKVRPFWQSLIQCYPRRIEVGRRPFLVHKEFATGLLGDYRADVPISNKLRRYVGFLECNGAGHRSASQRRSDRAAWFERQVLKVELEMLTLTIDDVHDGDANPAPLP